MARPQKHPKTGVYRVRKVVPEDLRAVVGKRELVESLGTKDPTEARKRHGEVLARFERQLEAARAEASGVSRRLTAREIASIAGEVYRAEVERAEADPGTPSDAHLSHDALYARLSYVGAGHDDEPVMEFVPTARDLLEARTVLSERGVSGDPQTVEGLARAIFSARTYAAHVAIRRAVGDWSPDPDATRFPAPQPVAAPPVIPSATRSEPLAPAPAQALKLSTDQLLSKFAAENPQPPKTMAKREAAMRHIERAAGHGDAIRITKADVRAMKEARQAAKRSPATIRAEIGSLRPVWAWGITNGLLPEGPNPFSGMNPKAPKVVQRVRLPFDDDEAALMLRAAREEKGWKRWVPWVLAFTGARLEEVCGANAADVREVRGAWILDINTEHTGRNLKTGQSVRMVPLHSALIAEGFVEYARKLPKGAPLFPDLPEGSWDKRSSIATKHMGRWLRKKVGITDPRKVAGHSWRHRMKDALRFARIPVEAADAILGHDNPVNAGSGYGDGWRGRPDETAVELEKVKSPLG